MARSVSSPVMSGGFATLKQFTCGCGWKYECIAKSYFSTATDTELFLIILSHQSVSAKMRFSITRCPYLVPENVAHHLVYELQSKLADIGMEECADIWKAAESSFQSTTVPAE